MWSAPSKELRFITTIKSCETKILKNICKSGEKRESKEVNNSSLCTDIQWWPETYQNPVVLGCLMSNGHHCWKQSAEKKNNSTSTEGKLGVDKGRGHYNQNSIFTVCVLCYSVDWIKKHE